MLWHHALPCGLLEKVFNVGEFVWELAVRGYCQETARACQTDVKKTVNKVRRQSAHAVSTNEKHGFKLKSLYELHTKNANLRLRAENSAFEARLCFDPVCFEQGT